MLDSQNFGVAQRRRRVVSVESLGNASCAEVLFESEGLSRDIKSSREEGEETARTTVSSLAQRGYKGINSDNLDHMIPSYWDGGQKSDTLDSSSLMKGQMMPEKRRFPVVFDEMQITSKTNKSNGNVDQSYTLNNAGKMSVVFQRSQLRTQDKLDMLDIAPTLKSETKSGDTEVNVWQMNHASEVYRECWSRQDRLEFDKPIAPTLQERMGTGGNNVPLFGVRRLTPTECCRLQGFPDDWNSSVSDTQRYKQMGNAVTVNVIECIGDRIIKIERNNTYE
mgnify:CR=1 FL=1